MWLRWRMKSLCSEHRTKGHMTMPFMFTTGSIWQLKDAIQLQEGTPLSLDACNASNCVYMVHRRFTVTISRITRDDDNQFQISSMISGLYLPNPTLSVTANGDLILSRRRGEDRAVINVYSATGVLQHEMSVPMYISRLRQIVPKLNGNIVLISAHGCRKSNGKYVTRDWRKSTSLAPL